MTMAEMVADLKNMIGPAGKGAEVGDAGLKVWLNEAYTYALDEVLSINPDYLNATATTSLVISQGEYALPDDFEQMIAVEVMYDGSSWVRAIPLPNQGSVPTPSDTNQGYSTAKPYYYIEGSKIGLQPIPSASVAHGLKLHYAALKSELEDSESPSLPRRFHYALKYWAYANYLDQADEHVAAERMRLRFDAKLAKMIETLSINQVDAPKSVVIEGDSDLYVDLGNY